MEIKHAGLWKVTDPDAKLACKKGRWIVGSRKMKSSEHYPEFLGESVALILLLLTTDQIVDRLSDDIVSSLRPPTDPDDGDDVTPAEPVPPLHSLLGDNVSQAGSVVVVWIKLSLNQTTYCYDMWNV